MSGYFSTHFDERVFNNRNNGKNGERRIKRRKVKKLLSVMCDPHWTIRDSFSVSLQLEEANFEVDRIGGFPANNVDRDHPTRHGQCNRHVTNIIVLAFFFMLRPAEYLKPRGDEKHSTPFCLVKRPETRYHCMD